MLLKKMTFNIEVNPTGILKTLPKISLVPVTKYVEKKKEKKTVRANS